MTLTLEEYREILSWYAKKKYYEQKLGDVAPQTDREFVNMVHRKLREGVRRDQEEAPKKA
jgi:hypothetical protein